MSSQFLPARCPWGDSVGKMSIFTDPKEERQKTHMEANRCRKPDSKGEGIGYPPLLPNFSYNGNRGIDSESSWQQTPT
jgi:hypothetical protein